MSPKSQFERRDPRNYIRRAGGTRSARGHCVPLSISRPKKSKIFLLRYKNNLLVLLGPPKFLTFRHDYVLFLSLLVMVTATSTEKYRCLFEQLEHYLGGIIWGAKNDQVGVIFSVILLVVEISITASLLRL